MAEERFVLTRAGYDELQRELTRLKARRQDQMDTFSDMSDYWDIDPSPEGGYGFFPAPSEHVRDNRGIGLEQQDVRIAGMRPEVRLCPWGDRLPAQGLGQRMDPFLVGKKQTHAAIISARFVAADCCDGNGADPVASL